MLFTIGELAVVPPAPDPLGGSVAKGLRVLQGIVLMTALPRDEGAALEALRAMHKHIPLDAEATQASRALEADLRRLRADDVRTRLDWLEEKLPWWRLDRAQRIHRRERARLLFVLLAVIAAPYLEVPVLNEVVSRRWLGGGRNLDALLACLRSARRSTADRGVCRSYLTLFRDAVVEVSADATAMSPVGDTAADPTILAKLVSDFMGWSWTRQLMCLEKRRLDGNVALAGPNPDPWRAVQCGHAEFALARAGAYSQLARRGGALAQESLAGMGYRDYVPRHRHVPRVRIIVFWSLIVGAVIAAFALAYRAGQWDRANRDYVKAARSSLEVKR
jgi:hypothetical protein